MVKKKNVAAVKSHETYWVNMTMQITPFDKSTGQNQSLIRKEYVKIIKERYKILNNAII